MATPHNIPAELTSFIGREAQLTELKKLLRRSRLLTLTGPGGAGKTRLALRLAAECLDRYPDGVWHFDLAPITDVRLLELTVAAACGFTEDAKRPMVDVLTSGLDGRRVLLVFDGCEHLVDACAELIAHLLRSCPRLTIVATSREPLGVTGEVIWRTPSLTTPRPEDSARPELLMESESIRLFVDRARLSRPEFELQPSGAAALAQICRRLEGIPLAIELAAGLAGVMTVQEILDRLGQRFRLLTGGSRSSVPRHQTLRQAVDWSHGLLSPTEQALFARLGVFAGGFDLAAAEAIVPDESIAADDVFPLLSRLINKSLVVAEPTVRETTRYRLLDTIREYALEKLQQEGEAAWRRRHADYFTAWAAGASKKLFGREQEVWAQRIDDEQPNIRLALEWSLSEQPDNALRLAGAMGSYWWMRRTLGEGFEWLTRATEVVTSDVEYRPAALVARARLARRRGDYETAVADANAAASMARRLGLKRELAQAVTMLGIAASHDGDLAKAKRYFEETTKLSADSGDRDRLSAALNNIAMIESVMGDQDSAMRKANEAEAVADELGDRFLKSNVLDTVARIHFRLGHIDVARAKYSEALLMASDFQDMMNVADCLEGFALLAMVAGDATRALVLEAAAGAQRTSAGADITPEWSKEVLDSIERAKAKVGPTAAEAATRRGAAMTMKEAVAYALGETTGARRDGGMRLSDREIQVARLVAEGLTNGEVGGRLRISERTVDAHVEHIRNKLGLRTRAQIAVWAKERLGTA